MRLLPGWSDAVPRVDRHDGSWLPWGVTPSFLELEPHGEFAPCAIVESVNSKIYSARLEVEFEVSLPRSEIVTSIAALSRAVAHGGGESLVKNPWGVAGRERLKTRTFDDEARAWAERQFRWVDELVVEPLVKRTCDWSIQFELGRDPRMVGACRLVTDSAGNHRGHRVDQERPADEIIDIARKAASRVHADGYRGPLGIDAFEGILGEEQIVRPLCELNARMTFGRLALELEAHVGRPFVWWHPPRSRHGEQFEPIYTGARDGTYRLPDFVDPSGRSGSLVVVGDDEPWEGI